MTQDGHEGDGERTGGKTLACEQAANYDLRRSCFNTQDAKRRTSLCQESTKRPRSGVKAEFLVAINRSAGLTHIQHPDNYTQVLPLLQSQPPLCLFLLSPMGTKTAV